MCTRAIGNLALKRLRIDFIQAQVYFLNAERKEEAVLLEQLRGAQEIADFYDLVNSPQPNSPEFADETTHTLAT